MKEHTTIMKSRIFQLSLKYALSSITNPYAIILNKNSTPKNIAKNQSAQSKKLLKYVSITNFNELKNIANKII